MPDKDMLADLVPRVINDPDFVAWALDKYRRSEGISEEALRVRLNVDQRTFVRLNLCEMPVHDPAHFARHVQEIANRTGVDAALLAGIFRQVAALEALPGRMIPSAGSQPHPATSPLVARKSMFMAARDHHEERPGVAEESVHYQVDSRVVAGSAEEADEETEAGSSTDAQPKNTPHTEKPSDDNPETRSASSNDPESC